LLRRSQNFWGVSEPPGNLLSREALSVLGLKILVVCIQNIAVFMTGEIIQGSPRYLERNRMRGFCSPCHANYGDGLSLELGLSGVH
jgi:hypothetical protein